MTVYSKLVGNGQIILQYAVVKKTKGLAAEYVNHDVMTNGLQLMSCLRPCFTWHFCNLRSLHIKRTLKSEKLSTLQNKKCSNIWQSANKIFLQFCRSLQDLLKIIGKSLSSLLDLHF